MSNIERALEREIGILDQLLEEGRITPEEHRRLVRELEREAREMEREER